MKFKSATLVVLAAALTIVPSASAVDYLDVFKNYLNTRGLNQPAQNQDLIKTNINNRQAQLESQVQAGVRSGQLTAREEADLRAELNRIAASEGAFLADGTLTNLEVQTLLDEFSSFSRRLDAYLTNAETTAAGSTTFQREWYNPYRRRGNDDAAPNQVQLQANIDTRQARLDSEIGMNLNSGLLSWSESRSLQSALQTIAAKEYQFLSDGRLSYREANELINDLDELEARMRTLIANSTRGRGRGRALGQSGRPGAAPLNVHQSLLRQRIQQGLISGRLTRAEANRLLQDEQRIALLEAEMRASGGRLTLEEQRRLLRELENLSRKITRELNDRQVQWN